MPPKKKTTKASVPVPQPRPEYIDEVTKLLERNNHQAADDAFADFYKLSNNHLQELFITKNAVKESLRDLDITVPKTPRRYNGAFVGMAETIKLFNEIQIKRESVEPSDTDDVDDAVQMEAMETQSNVQISSKSSDMDQDMAESVSGETADTRTKSTSSHDAHESSSVETTNLVSVKAEPLDTPETAPSRKSTRKCAVENVIVKHVLKQEPMSPVYRTPRKEALINERHQPSPNKYISPVRAVPNRAAAGKNAGVQKTPLRAKLVDERKADPKRNASDKRRILDEKLRAAEEKKQRANHEKAEKLRADIENKQQRVKMNRAEQEAQNRAKLLQLEERAQQALLVREQNKASKSPGRSAAPSRIASPARVLKKKLIVPEIAVNLFPTEVAHTRTPGRTVAKVAKVVTASGDVAKTEMPFTPSRDATRKRSRARAVEETSSNNTPKTNESKQEQMRKLLQMQEEEQQRRDEERERREEELRRERELEEARLREEYERKEHERLAKEAREAERLEKKRQWLLEEAERQSREEEESKEEERRKELEKENIVKYEKPVNKHLLNASFNDRSSIKSQDSYQMTPEKVFLPASENNYNIEDLSSGDETDNEDAPRKIVPKWADGARLKAKASEQFDPNLDYSKLTGYMKLPTMYQVFGDISEKQAKKGRRHSSGKWNSPMSNPTKGVSKFLGF